MDPHNPQEIIMYRNPLEYQLWHSDTGMFVPVVCACVVFILGFVLSHTTWETINRRRRQPTFGREPIGTLLTISGLLALATLYFMI